MDKSPKSYLTGAEERYSEIEDAREEKTKSAKMRVVSVQKGPYRSGAGVKCVEK